MHRLSGEDAGFLLMDRPGQPMNSMAIGVLTGEHATLTLDVVRAHLAARLDELPSWRWRIVPVPGHLHHPVAVRDADFDLDAHVREVEVAGGQRELEAWFAALAEEHLPTDRPLWQVWLVTGLDDGDQALVVKYHHALADGVAAITTLSRVFSDLPLEPPAAEPGAGPGAWRPERSPRGPRLVLAALWAWLVALVALPALLARTVGAVRRVRAERERQEQELAERGGAPLPEGSGDAPRTSLNVAPSAPTAGRRVYARAALELADLKTIKEAAGVTLNDAVMGVVAGACVRLLAARGETPDRPLLTTVPMAAEPPGAPVRQFGNRFWAYTASLATDVVDPWERLQRIAEVSAAGKQRLQALGVDLVPAWLDVIPPGLARRGVEGSLERLSDVDADVDASILVSNVRGPSQPWSIGGRVFSDLHLDGPPSNGVGCNVMVWSYGERMLLGILAYADALPDPGELVRALEESCAELVAAARASSGVGAVADRRRE